VNLPARGRAAGKVILLGEHAVVYRRPALVAGLSLGLEADVVSGDGPRLESGDYAGDPRGVRLVAEAAGAVGLEPRGVVVRVRSALPAGVGLGSSAALAVAVLRALAAAAARRLARDEELEIATRLEAIFHGHPSGVDPAGAALGGCFRFVRGTPPAIIAVRPAVPLPLVIAFGARPRSTGAAVGGLRARWDASVISSLLSCPVGLAPVPSPLARRCGPNRRVPPAAGAPSLGTCAPSVAAFGPEDMRKPASRPG